MEQITTIGLDIAKHVFHVHAVDARAVCSEQADRPVWLLAFFAPVSRGAGGLRRRPSLGPRAAAAGSRVRLIAPAYVKPFVKRQKNDAADAQAICEAAQRPAMRFVAVKSEEQQAARWCFADVTCWSASGPRSSPPLPFQLCAHGRCRVDGAAISPIGAHRSAAVRC